MVLQNRNIYLKGEISMKTFKFRIRFISDRKCIDRCEWGRTMKQALKTLESIYGKGTFTVVSVA